MIPPKAPLSPNSRVQPSQLGKTPGRKLGNGTWAGYSWLKEQATLDDVKQWSQDGANIGLLAEFYPGVDIDSLDPWVSEQVAIIAQRVLGKAPSRVGKAPKQLLMYRTGEPFARMAVILSAGREKHLVEVLGAGRQYLIHGQHPSGSRYTWDLDIAKVNPNSLTFIEQADIERFLQEVTQWAEVLGMDVQLVGDGRLRDRSDHPQADLLAPSIDALAAVVRTIPNTDALFPTREDYIKMGYAIRAAVGDDDESGYEIFAEWASRHTADDRVAGNPDTWRADWRRMGGPYSVGWGWLCDISGGDFNAAEFEFDIVDVERDKDDRPPKYSDIWLANEVIEEYGQQIRFIPASERWYVWEGGRWAADAVMLADHLISRTLKRLASVVIRRGVTPKEQKGNLQLANKLCSATAHRNVRHLLRSDPRITAKASAFDADPWLLNTPGGTLNLQTGELAEHDAATLCSRQTLVAPDFDMECPVWDKFLMEAAGGDVQLQSYLQRLAGYSLTGSTEEQMLAFLWGPGGNGKSVFMNAIMAIVQDYGQQAPMDTFTSSNADRHPTDLAGLMGARLVTAAETQSGRRWDEQRVKALTGGDLIRARFMRQDFFTYKPLFTLIFIGNHKPAIRDIDDAIRRRVHLVPFTTTPRVVDTMLSEKLIAEYPAILAWMVRGCLLWQDVGLAAPKRVTDATQEYFEEEDPVGRWLVECCETTDDWGASAVTTVELFRSWEQWANARGEYVGSMKRLSQRLVAKHFPKTREPDSRRMAFGGLLIRTNPITEDLI